MKIKTSQKIGLHLVPFNDMVVFDIETTGLSSRYDEIIQIAAIRILNGSIIPNDFFFSYIKPQCSIPGFITAYTGITEHDVKKAPSLSKILPEFSIFCNNSLIIAHNGQRFDLPFIFHSCRKHNIKTRISFFCDSIHLSWNLWGKTNGIRHNLDSVISRLKISTHGFRRHDARDDASITAACVCQMIKRIENIRKNIFVNIYQCELPEIN